MRRTTSASRTSGRCAVGLPADPGPRRLNSAHPKPDGETKRKISIPKRALDRPHSYRDDNRLANIRSHKIGFVFQSFNLISRTSAIRNVELPLVYTGARARRAPAQLALEHVGLGERQEHMPNELSGGQQQRVAIARALINDPTILLADEPTGNLDTASSIAIMKLLRALNDTGRTILIITHEEDIAKFAKRTVRMRDGHIESDQVADRTGVSA
jgi:putative ABC transport system ATP-binding protein